MSSQYPPQRVIDRVLAEVDRSGGPDACWPWPGYLQSEMYGLARWGESGTRCRRYVHIIMFEHVSGPVPEGLEIDHLCHGWDLSCKGGRACMHRRCANPAHLEAVTHVENVSRGRSFMADYARRTHCPHGHEYTPENTYLERNGTHRVCRECKLARNRERGYAYRERKRLERGRHSATVLVE